MVVEFRPLAGCARPAIRHAAMGGARMKIQRVRFYRFG